MDAILENLTDMMVLSYNNANELTSSVGGGTTTGINRENRLKINGDCPYLSLFIIYRVAHVNRSYENDCELTRLDLGPDAVAFLKESLRAVPLTLTQLVLQCVNFDRGRVFTFVPSPVDPRWKHNFIGCLCSRIRLQQIDDVTFDFVCSFLEKNNDAVFISEDPMYKRNKICSRESKVCRRYNNQEVYVYTRIPSRKSINWVVAESETVCLLNAYVATLPIVREWASECEFGEGELDALAHSINYVIISAYDQEGYLIWEATNSV